MIVHNGGPGARIDQATLFPFDDRSVPLRYRVRSGLSTPENPGGPQVCVRPGEAGSPDAVGILFYGTVLRVEDEFRMWYVGVGEDVESGGGLRVCYAVSRDGINWNKPVLGLVEYNGNSQNNLVAYDHDDAAAALVLYEPEDPDPNRRFKLICEVNPWTICAAYSPDGLRWTDSPYNPILKHNDVEPGGLMKFGDCYYLTGQGGRCGTKRALVTYLSYDFDHWADAVCIGLRHDVPPFQQMPGGHAGEQIHLGTSLWNRGNVILGLFGQWHGEHNDRTLLTMDLGFVVSNDGLHYVEPIPGFQMIVGWELQKVVRQGRKRYLGDLPFPTPTLMQGQGFENFGEETMTWYSPWKGPFICVARWTRDRLGYCEVVAERGPERRIHPRWEKLPGGKIDPHVISAPIQLDRPARVYVNASGLSEPKFRTLKSE
ncbi:MAG: hypothetical protein FJ280_27395 [Planctomycetes bacterium]|nr:hypothetical protein [Planctomycetota bacterium]